MGDEVMGKVEMSVAGTAPRGPLLGGRLAGPGGHYNLGNVIGLVGGVTLAVAAQAEVTLQTGLAAVWQHMVGNLAAISISVAMLMFFWSGEHYHQAWSRGFPPLARRNRLGDLWSGYGALALGLGLWLMGEPLLAATAGLMHAAGKFGSAVLPSRSVSVLGVRADLYRSTVLASRVPALVLVGIEIAGALAQEGPVEVATVASSLMLLVCYLIWARADVMLFRAG
jgi:hypothetical protein